MLGYLLVGSLAFGFVALPGAMLVAAVPGRGRGLVAALSAVGALLFALNVMLAYGGMDGADGGVLAGDFAIATMIGGIVTGFLTGGPFVAAAALMALRARALHARA